MNVEQLFYTLGSIVMVLLILSITAITVLLYVAYKKVKQLTTSFESNLDKKWKKIPTLLPGMLLPILLPYALKLLPRVGRLFWRK